MFRASLCPSSRDRLNRTASGVSLDVLAAVVYSQDTSLVHCSFAKLKDFFFFDKLKFFNTTENQRSFVNFIYPFFFCNLFSSSHK